MLFKTKQKVEQQVREENSIQVEVKDFHSKKKDTINSKVQQETHSKRESVTDAHKYKEGIPICNIQRPRGNPKMKKVGRSSGFRMSVSRS